MTDIRKFKLSDLFLEEYKEKKVDWGPVGEFTYLRTYSRILEDEGNRKEKWWETVRRVVEGCFTIQKQHCHSLNLPWNDRKAQRSAKIMYEKIFTFKFLPPGRSLWLMGTNFTYKRGSACLNNCGAVTTEDIDTRGSKPFTWAMDALMLGVGVGFDTKGESKIEIQKPKTNKKKTFTVPDSREGWVESVGLLLDAYFLGKDLFEYDYSLVRAYGEPIRGFGGKASGPDPLKDLLNNVSKLLESRIGQLIKSTDIVDIMNMIGVCVVAGNVRRSAEIALGDAEDQDFREMKDYTKHPDECASHRWSSNNSVLAKIGETGYGSISKAISLNGEPGLVWLENIQKFGRLKDGIQNNDRKACLVNPCSEISLESYELCNLSEMFPSRHESLKEFMQTIKYAYLYAKSVSLLPTHWPETNAVMMKNRRIGLSHSGIIDAFTRHGRREMLRWCDESYSYTRELDHIYSDWLCVPKSIKITTVKPSGSISLLPGVSPGIHYPHAEYYIRRIRVAMGDPLVSMTKDAGYHVEPDKVSQNTMVISFPIKEKYFERKKDDVSLWEQVDNCVAYQTYWADNNVSITVTFKKDEAKDIPYVLSANEDKLKAISFLPLSEHGYEQAPYEEIDRDQYDLMSKGLKEVDYSGLTSYEPVGEKFCDGDKCII